MNDVPKISLLFLHSLLAFSNSFQKRWMRENERAGFGSILALWLASPSHLGVGCVQMALFYVLVGLGFMGLIGSVVWHLAFSGVSLYLPNGG